MLDVTRLSHGYNVAVVVDVENAVLLEDRAKHVLHDDRGRRVRDEARLLVQLLGEEVDTEVAVLAGLGRDGDADDLARTTLEDQEIADADVVAGKGDGVGSHGAGWTTGAGLAVDSGGGRRWDLNFLLLDFDLYAVDVRVVLLMMAVVAVVIVVVVVVMEERGAVDGVADTFGNALSSSAEGVVMAVVVVVSHITLVLGWVYGATGGGLLDTNLSAG